MFRLTVREQFAAAHQLKNYEGKCARIHGHTWQVEVEVAGETLDEAGMLVDFNELKRSLKEILEDYDHTLLNELADFKEANPTAENLARTIYIRMAARIPEKVKVVQVRVWESPTACAIYHP
ncbi:6-carboxytetrahydropterin synthase QueD [Calderihabitans maritimus]|uniref:6-carboxy-5,6,7,8-tetrahydropterin synthase n=1 Tax=Calderihabitans maritimus TaxID=1246530 RepID=A0A1Z5HXH9_9FIRM|nr:6-carboxytetrahydropterin synthase QueD [Calderihabitans maritimus]GAW94239.1 queuosine biosynthesis protein QueD [Calderihabitans maritimus]